MIKLLEDSVGKKLINTGLDSEILDMMPMGQTTKIKINKWNYIKLKRFHTEKDNQKMKRQPKEWEKKFTNHTSSKKLIFKIYKELIQLDTKIQSIQLITKHTFFSKELIKVANRLMKRCSTPLLIRKMQSSHYGSVS